MMIGAHISDSHGLLTPIPGDAEVVFHSGDLMPNRTRGIVAIERVHQDSWLRLNADRLQDWIGDRLFLFTGGNHDYIDPCPVLRGFGLNAHNLYEEGPYQLGKYTVVGFPFVPRFTGEWNFELDKPSMEWAISAHLAPHFVQDRKTILVAHSPIYGVLDRNFRGTRCGSFELRQFMQGCPYPPEYYLTGHIHEANGKCGPWNIEGTMFYNSATTCHRLILTD